MMDMPQNPFHGPPLVPDPNKAADGVGGPPSDAGGPPTPLAYEDAPQRAQATSAGGVLRLSAPVSPSIRREVWRWPATRTWSRFLFPFWLVAEGSLVKPLMFGPRFSWRESIVLVPLLAVLAAGILAVVGCVAGWITSRMARPVFLQFDGQWLAASSPHRSGEQRWHRSRIRRVVVEPAGHRGIGYLLITVGFDPVRLAVGGVDDLEFVAAELRSAMALPPNKAADGIGGPPSDAGRPPMPSAALLERP